MTKHCSGCDTEKPETEFARKTATRRQSRCKECQRAYTKKWYAANAETHKANVHQNNVRQRKQMQALVAGHLAKTPCRVCKKRFAAAAMTFDVPWEESAKHLAHTAYSETAVREALAKQKVICVNCRATTRENRA